MWQYELHARVDNLWRRLVIGPRCDLQAALTHWPLDERGFRWRVQHRATGHHLFSYDVRDILNWLESPDRLLEPEWTL